MKEIKTQRLLLRGLKSYDLYDIYEILRDEDLTKKALLRPLKDVDGTMEFLEFLMEEISLGIELFDERKIIGYISLMDLEEKEINGRRIKLANMGYIINKDYQNMGHGKEAIYRAIRYFFKEYKLDLMGCEYLEDNSPSERLLIKLGFEFSREIEIEDLDGNIKRGIRRILRRDML